MNFDKNYIIGIDLGTTNCAVSYIDLVNNSSDSKKIKQTRIFKVPQLIGPGEFAGLSVLPSFLYIPGEYDIAKEAMAAPWKISQRSRQDKNFVGAFARDHGAKVPARLVSSAKSWLCHSGVDRLAPILPWNSSEDILKISPIQATAAYLKHIKKAWNINMAKEDEYLLENELVILTVPASFDEVARDLTLQAANMAGLRDVILLEEPLAGFYSWLVRHEENWNDYVKTSQLILVCDVGGGTTDFTLIILREVDGSPRFERIAVGNHHILGGDNIDLALAEYIEKKVGKKKLSLNHDKWKSLCHQCRQAKEEIFENRLESKRITLMGSGRRLIAGTISTQIDRDTVEKIILDEFFPLIESPAEYSPSKVRDPAESGLPYEKDPAITRHLINFLKKHQSQITKATGKKEPLPDLILFNGGTLKPTVIRERIKNSIRKWLKNTDEKTDEKPVVLSNPDLDLAVARGAAYYGLVKSGKGVRVGSGSPRTIYLEVEQQNIKPEKSEKKQDIKTALCLVERGLEEGSDIELSHHAFEVLANHQVNINLYTSSFRSGDKCGDLIKINDSFTRLAPLQTIIKFGKKGVKTLIPVKVGGSYTEVGTLELWCKSQVSNHRWHLNFQLRGSDSKTAIKDEEVFDTELIDKLCLTLKEVFKDPKGIKNLDKLIKTLTRLIEKPREKWPLGLIRKLADQLLDLMKLRKLSLNHEIRWLNLVGFFLRPGFGDGFDDQRIKKLWQIYNQGLINGNKIQARTEWWIMWRRVAGGLQAGHQRQFAQALTKILAPKKGGASRISPQERLEIWMALANMEQLQVKDKVKWGRQLLKEINQKKPVAQHFWALSRMGARELFYGSLDRVVGKDEVSAWIEKILSKKWSDPKPVGFAIIQMARRTGDRVRDLDQALIERIIEWLSANSIPGSYWEILQKVKPLEKQETQSVFGESLPAGIIITNKA